MNDDTLRDFHHEGRCCPFLAEHTERAVEQARADERERLCEQLDDYANARGAAIERADKAEVAIERVRALGEKWRYKGEFGWGPWQEGDGPDEEGYVLDRAPAELRAALDGTRAVSGG